MEELVIMILNVYIKKITKSLGMMKRKVNIEEITLREEQIIEIKRKGAYDLWRHIHLKKKMLKT